MASIKKINERKFKITISNGYRADGRKISKAKTVTVPDAVPRKQIEQYVNHAAVELERVFKIEYAEYGEMNFEEYCTGSHGSSNTRRARENHSGGSLKKCIRTSET